MIDKQPSECSRVNIDNFETEFSGFLTDRYIAKMSHLEDVTFCVDSN